MATYMYKVLGTPTGTTKNTLSLWFKKSKLGADQGLVFANSNAGGINLHNDDGVVFYNAGGTLRTNRRLRDISAWYHIVVVTDTTLGTADDRLKMYINGVQETSFSTRTNPSVNATSSLGSATEHIVGANNSPANYYDGYMAMCEMVDGQALTAAYFGSTDSNTGIWKPGGSSTISSYGDNGFKLAMDTATLGADTSGEGNTFAANANGRLTQGSPSNVYTTWNSLIPGTTNYVYSNGNNTVNQTSGSWKKTVSTLGMTKGKWYWEVKAVDANTSAGRYTVIGVANTTTSTAASGMPANGIGYKSNGEVQRLGAITNIGAYTAGDIISCYLDMDNEALYYAKNGAMLNSGVPTSGASKTGAFTMPVANSTYFAHLAPYGTNSKAEANFGEGYFGTTTAGTQADDNGQGKFAYDVPTGYYAINTKNLEAYG